jgi:hypothetical protein
VETAVAVTPGEEAAGVLRREQSHLTRLASRTPRGRPAICPELEPGEAVGIARADVHWVITEYGTAYLFGRSLAERAVALVEIAHPDDRAELLAAVAEQRLVSRRQQLRSRRAYPVGEERIVRQTTGQRRPFERFVEGFHIAPVRWRLTTEARWGTEASPHREGFITPARRSADRRP